MTAFHGVLSGALEKHHFVKLKTKQIQTTGGLDYENLFLRIF
jgi:hypothetical protein